MQTMTVKDFVELLKLKQTALLVFTAVASYFAAPAQSWSLRTAALLFISEVLAVGGTTAVNMYFDRDIDALMDRTKERPLPAGRLNPPISLAYGLAVYTTGLALSLTVSFYLFITILLGFVFDIFVYTLYFKRKTPLNIIFGGVAGGMPAMGGWLTRTGCFDPGALLAFLLVFLWIPMHIWFISIYYLEDYKKSRVPMLPVVVGPVRTAKFIMVSLVLLEAVVMVMTALQYATLFTLVVSTLLTAFSIRVMWKFSRDPRREVAKQLFKFASPYLAVVFICIIIGRLLGI